MVMEVWTRNIGGCDSVEVVVQDWNREKEERNLEQRPCRSTTVPYYPLPLGSASASARMFDVLQAALRFHGDGTCGSIPLPNGASAAIACIASCVDIETMIAIGSSSKPSMPAHAQGH